MNMKILFLSWVLGAVSSLSWSAISWDSYESGIKKAGDSGRPMMVDFYADWCGWCKKLDMEVYTDTGVQKSAEGFVCIKVDCDRETELSQKFEINGLPTILLLSPQGEVIQRVEGFVEKETLNEYMQEALKKVPPKPQSNDAVSSAGPVSYSRADYKKAGKYYQLGIKMEGIARKPQAINYYAKAVKLAPGSKWAKKSQSRINELKNANT
jgi:thioredoxin-like negative regulator of GroEL